MPPKACVFGLKQHTIQQINQIFANYTAIDKAILYGSRATGAYRSGSDIDLTLTGHLTQQQLSQIATQLDDLLLPYTIDLSILHDIDNQELVNHINRVGKVFYSK